MAKENLTHMIALRLPPELAARVDQEVEARQASATSWAEKSCTRADVIRDALVEVLDRREAERAPTTTKRPAKRKAAGR